MSEVKYTYQTHVIGRRFSGTHHTHDLDEAKRLSSNGAIWRKPTGDWEIVPTAEVNLDELLEAIGCPTCTEDRNLCRACENLMGICFDCDPRTIARWEDE